MKNSVTVSLLKKAKKDNGNSEAEIAYLEDYYHRLSGQDYSDDRAEFFVDAAKKHLSLAQKRAPDSHLVKIDQFVNQRGNPRSLISIVTNDRPFIIDSLANTLVRLNKRIDRTNHPIFDVVRNKKNKLTSLTRRKSGDIKPAGNLSIEAFIQFETDAISKEEIPLVADSLKSVLVHVEMITEDWKEMRQAALDLGDMVDQKKQGPSFAEYQALLQWMAEDHFAFIGYGEVEQTTKSSGEVVNKVLHQSLKGILRVFDTEGRNVLSVLPPLVESQTAPLIFTKSRERIHIHRANYLDVILIDHDFGTTARTKNRKRRISCIVGFLAGSTTTMAINTIPHLRSKAAYILKESTLRERSYAYKSLRTILETLPREMLFQVGSKALYSLCMTLLNHQERRKTRVHIKHNVCGHFYSCLVYVPRELFNTELRKRIQMHLGARLGAREVTFNVRFSESILTQIHFTAFVDKPAKSKNVRSELEGEIQLMAQDWSEQLVETVQNLMPLDQANALLASWREGFSPNYRLDHSADTAARDIQLLEQYHVIDLGNPGVRGLITARVECVAGEDASHLRLYSADQAMPLSDALPILDNMGLRVPGEHTYSISHADAQTYWINHFQIVGKNNKELSSNLKQVIEDGFLAIWFGHCENDGFNELITLTGLSWRQVNVVRCFFRYLKQIRLRYSDGHIIESLLKYPDLVVAVVALFEAKFTPGESETTVLKWEQKITKLLPDIQTLDEERIFNALLDTLRATVRTNYYQTCNGENKSTITLKLAPRTIPRIPEPAPLHEIFVYSPRVEGVHLRGGDVARGGLRWSERPDDFRTEVLGLVKAQQVKNAVIVPVGSKGGFVAKKLPTGDRDQIQKEVIACYKLFISGLLDITDNIQGKKIIAAKDCVRLDGNDPYLVVAADKGTATFSDIANALSEEACFWLGDAFASGGSEGYDHKKMGITARGAWESVKRHFRELGKDIQNQTFTAVAIGDMAGDVFGNGMLLSPHTRLIAAFNHLHIFIDPTPDAQKSYKERQRLFDLPRSSWTDYNEKLISKGGGIYSRTAKSISLSNQAMKALSTEQSQLTPDELINVILKSEAELLWNGGIGTYVKSSEETNEDAQDRNNDAVRVNAHELRVKVIGEGGNLGLTQNARIEFNRHGGLCYTDAIDNSAGVDTSDHEVNIKILLNQLVERKKLSMPQRNRLLSQMEEAVGEHVLKNNYVQTEVVSIEATFAKNKMPSQVLALQALTQSGLLKRDIEHLPDDDELLERAAQENPLTRAELSVLLAYSKMDLYDYVLESNIPLQKHMQSVLLSYFPPLLVKKFESEVLKHPLGKEIISTVLVNDLIGTMGPTFHFRMMETTGSSREEIVRAYWIARQIVGSEGLISYVRSGDNHIPASLQQKLLVEISEAIESNVLWLLDHSTNLEAPGILKRYAKPVAEFSKKIKKLDATVAPESFQKINDQLSDASADFNADSLNHVWAYAWLLDICETALSNKISVGAAMECYFAVSQKLDLGTIATQIRSLPAEDRWRQQAKSTLASSLRQSHANIAASVVQNNPKKSVSTALQNWIEQHPDSISTLNDMVRAVESEPTADFAILSVVVSELEKLTLKDN
ncbi:MAG: NAD-glutamate dehydrogenase [Acidiferrobacterales bacterium]|nr:NAD-glutamate dehydrogenase [Acidiferrobacterales bacterium]